MSLSALVLAGSRGAGCPVAAMGGVSHKAILPILGIPMVERVIATLRAVPEIDRITLMIEDPALIRALPGLAADLDSGYLDMLPARPSPAQSALYGFGQMGGAAGAPILVTTADNCLLTPGMVTFFLAALRDGTDLTAATARTDMVQAAYPEARRTRLRFRDGARGGCNLFALQTPDAGRVIGFWRRVEQNRKHPLAMLRQIGALTALGYLLGGLSLDQALRGLGRRTGARLAVTDMPFPEAAIDVDTPEDFHLAERILAAR
ncbi:MAG: NTP transferase domain-containing protein [Paracoccus sp. (in: a-proteobacteria)]